METLMSPAARRRGQRGVSLFFALVALISLALAAVALVRSVDTGALVIGNLGFKQDATASSDQATEAAIAWLQTRLAGTTLDANDTAAGYSASSLDQLDVTGNGTAAGRALVDWQGDQCGGSGGVCVTPSTAATYNGNSARYVITRLCPAAGAANATGNSCAMPSNRVTTQGPNRGEIRVGTARFSPASGGPYFRIVVRTVGGRGTVSFTETIVHF